MNDKYYNTERLNISPWPFLCFGLVGVILFILLLPLFLGVVVVLGAVAGYCAWRLHRFLTKIEKDIIWKNQEDYRIYDDNNVIDITPSSKNNKA